MTFSVSRRSKIAYALVIITLLVGTIFVMYEFEILDVDEFIDDILYPYDGPIYNRTGNPLSFYSDKLGIDIGTAIHHYTWKLSDDSEIYTEVMATEFNSMSFEYVISMDAIWLGPDRYNYDWADDIVKFAQENNKTLRGSHLVWYATLPDWLLDGSYSSSEVVSLIETYVTDTMTYYSTNYPGVITEWNVANEVINNDDSSDFLYREGFLIDNLGTDWVRKVFTWARTADPDVTLLLNEYDMLGTEEDIAIKVDKTYQVVSDLNDLGLIDGVGFQGHLSLEYEQDWAYNSATMRRFTDLNLTVAITELDVTINDDLKGLTDDKLVQQADIFVEVFKLCLDNDLCTGITVWGFTDKYHYINRGDSWHEQNKDWPVLFDFHYNPKPAYYAVQQLLDDRSQ